MVNNAGIGGVYEKDPELMISINLTAVIMGTIKAIEKMNKQKGGNGGLVVNIASIAGINIYPIFPTYTATKNGVNAYTRCLKDACHVDKVGVRVNSISPWIVKTPMTADIKSPKMKAIVEAHGFAEFSDVMKAFTLLLDDDTKHGSVIAVLPDNQVVDVPPPPTVGPMVEGFDWPCLF